MGELHQAVTRREILKRGAIVGGGVLWVTPVVQTLTMGPAHASAVSGDTCKMTMEIADCTPNPQGGYVTFLFKTCVPASCPCSPLPVGYTVRLIVIVEGGSGYGQSMYSVGEPNCYVSEFPLSGAAEVYAFCGTQDDDTSEIVDIKAESVHLNVTAADISACLETA